MSVLNLRKKFIFIHIPKTAGTSMEERAFMRPLTGRHHDITHYYYLSKRTPDIDLDELFKFTFVRNPYDRVASGIMNHPMRGKDITKESFNKYLQEHVEYLEAWVSTRPQWRFICLADKMMMDFVGRFENLRQDWRYVCKKLNVGARLPHLVRSGRSYKDIYTDESKEIIRRVYKKDFELLGYKQ